MKFTLSWLKEHLDTDASLDEISDRLTMIGLEVEEIDDRAGLKPFTIAQIKTAEKHPDADKLKLCMVDIGSGEDVQVVCGAPNARAGIKVVFAAPGTYVPGLDVTLSVGKIRGVESRGMLCSESELELADDSDGIMELPDDAPVGQSFATWKGLDDPVFEIGLTPNRADCTGVHGIARDLAASGLGKMKQNNDPVIKGEGACPVSVTIEDTDLCPAFGLRLVRGVKNGPSPDWMQDRLRAIGLRPINALVDITNYITFDRGRPLHVFDAAKVEGNLRVGPAKGGEEFEGLDGKTYTMQAGMTIISDDEGMESLAGIMGGETTGCDETTTDVLVESALWSEEATAATGRKLGINTDARYRFERGVDPAYMRPGLDYATQMVIDLCGGEPTEAVIAGEVPDIDRVIDFPLSEIKRLTGLDVPSHEVKAIFQGLGFWMAGNGSPVKVAVPSWRADVEGKADLVEEIMRIVGVDRIPLVPSLGRDEVVKPVLTPLQVRTRKARRVLASRGLTEAVTWSFISKEQAQLFGGGDKALELANPIATELSDMRPSLLPGLLLAAQRNTDRGYGDVGLFEVGQVFEGGEPGEQSMQAASVRTGTMVIGGSGRHWTGSAEKVTAFDAKADALDLLATMGMDPAKVQITMDAPEWFHPGRSGVMRLGPNALGAFGELHPRLLKAMDIDGPVVAFTLQLDSVPYPKRKTTTRAGLNVSDLMPVRRDFAFVVDDTVEAGRLLRAANGADKNLIADVSLFDVYEGEHVGEGKKSIAIEVILQPRDKTLRDEDLEAISSKIVAAVEKATGGTLRA